MSDFIKGMSDKTNLKKREKNKAGGIEEQKKLCIGNDDNMILN